jgi:hypothetical protein
VDEQILKETPCLLHIAQQLDDIVDTTKILLPFLEKSLEEGNKFRQQHSVNGELMAFQDFEVVVEHFQSAHVAVLQRDKFEQDNFPEFDDSVDLFLHLGFVLGNFAYLFDSLLVVEKSQKPEEFEFEVLIHNEVLFDCFFDFLPMTSIGGDHGVVFEVGDHRDEDAPTFDLL